MTDESFLGDRVRLHCGDCLDVLAGMPGCSVDSCVTDPPYHLTSIVKRFGADDAAPAKEGKTGVYARSSAGFMGKKWDGGNVAASVETWRAVFRVLKPGAHLVAFSGTRTYHRMVCAIEDAGFEIRDQIGWAFGSGFPKSHNVSKAIDRLAGADRIVVSVGKPVKRIIPGSDQNKQGWEKTNGRVFVPARTIATTDEAKAWEGWGTAIKPAWEPIVLARKPLDGTVAENVLKWGVGALNIDGCRVDGAKPDTTRGAGGQHGRYGHIGAQGRILDDGRGRWPANLVHDGSEEVLACFPDDAGAFAPVRGTEPSKPALNVYGEFNRGGGAFHADGGSAARFFYAAKADDHDRIGSKHPTIKPIDLMQYLVRLVTPKDKLVLDPFAGTGTTAEAAFREGMRCILIERELEYQDDIRRRMALVLSGPDERKHKLNGAPMDAGPLFDGEPTAAPVAAETHP